jgi:hypothetical protein
MMMVNCNKRDLATPSKRLIGHWIHRYEITKEDLKIEKESNRTIGDTLSAPEIKEGKYETHYYIGKIDPKTKVGSYIMIDIDNMARHQYRIISEQLSGERVVIQRIFPGGDSRDETFFITKDGLSAISETELDEEFLKGQLFIDTLEYVDNKDKP